LSVQLCLPQWAQLAWRDRVWIAAAKAADISFRVTLQNMNILKNVVTDKIWLGIQNPELNAIRKHNCFLCSPFYVKGVSLGYVGRIET